MDANKKRWLGIGALITAGVASLCCIGPAVFLALGIGSLGAFAALAEYRPLFMGLTFLLLGFGFYFAYRKREVVCEDGSCKMASGSPRAKAAMWIVTVLALGFMSAPYWLGALSSAGKANASLPLPGTYQTVRLNVEGMYCSACAAHVQKSLQKVPGVLNANVDFDSKQATVRFSKGSASEEDLLKAVQEAGYTATVKEVL